MPPRGLGRGAVFSSTFLRKAWLGGVGIGVLQGLYSELLFQQDYNCMACTDGIACTALNGKGDDSRSDSRKALVGITKLGDLLSQQAFACTALQ